jgi:hypothetical protein
LTSIVKQTARRRHFGSDASKDAIKPNWDAFWTLKAAHLLRAAVRFEFAPPGHLKSRQLS